MQVINCKYLFSSLHVQLPLMDSWQKSSQSNSTGDDFPAFPFPPLPGTFYTVLSKVQMEMFNTMMVSKSEAEALEKETRQQSSNNMASCPLYSPYFNFIQEYILEEDNWYAMV